MPFPQNIPTKTAENPEKEKSNVLDHAPSKIKKPQRDDQVAEWWTTPQ